MTENDICAFHSYKHRSLDNPDTQAAFSLGLQSLSGLENLVERPLFADRFVYEGQPVMLTEAGEMTPQKEMGSALAIWMIIIMLAVICICNLLKKLTYKGGEQV